MRRSLLRHFLAKSPFLAKIAIRNRLRISLLDPSHIVKSQAARGGVVAVQYRSSRFLRVNARIFEIRQAAKRPLPQYSNCKMALDDAFLATHLLDRRVINDVAAIERSNVAKEKACDSDCVGGARNSVSERLCFLSRPRQRTIQFRLATEHNAEADQRRKQACHRVQSPRYTLRTLPSHNGG
jgi:hypothetical protein